MPFGLPAIGESNWGQKILDSINAVKDGAVPKWQPNTVYAAGDTVQAPDGSPVKTKVARTSSGSYSTTPASPPVLGAPTTATTGGTIAAGTTYYYKATALSAIGETLASAEVSRVIAAALATPVNAAFTTATTGGTLAAGTYSYRVSATNALGETLASTATTQVIAAALAAPVLNAPTTATTGGTLAAGTYYYKITATNAVGETIGSNEVSQVTTGTTSTVDLTWGAVTGATGYKIYRATTTGGQSTSPALVASVGAVTSYTDTGTAVSAGAVPATNTTATSTNTVTVNWGAVTGATGYKVYGRVGGSELLIATVGAVTTYTDTGSVTPAGALPTANTTATNTNTVGLSWAAVTGATGYKVYRATTTGGQSTSPALLATLGAVTSYTDTGSATTAGSVPTTNTANERAFWQSVNTYAGTQAETELSASTGGQGFDLIEDFSTYADGPLAGEETTSSPLGGGRLTWYSESTGGAVVPTIVGGALTIPAGVSGTIRAVLDLPDGVGDIIGIGMEVSYDGSFSDGSALACMAVMEGPFSEALPRMPVHFVASPEAWSLDVNATSGTAVDDANFGGLTDGGALLTNGTRYRFEVALDKTSERAYVTDSRGNVYTEASPAFNVPGKRAYFQVLRTDHTTQTRPMIHKVWLTTRRQDRIVSARAASRLAPKPQVVTVESGSPAITGSVTSISGASFTLPMPSSRAVRITGTAVVNVTSASDFYLGVALASAPTALMTNSESVLIVRSSQGTGTFLVPFDILLGPSCLDLSVGRIGDLVTLNLATTAAGGAASFVTGGSDRIRAVAQPLPFLS